MDFFIIFAKIKLMTKIYLLSGILFSALIYSQNLVGGINSGAVSNENLMQSVGEIYVIPTDPNQQNSGTMGVFYQTVLNFLGIDELVYDKVRVYPNPTSDYLKFSFSSKNKLEETMIYDLSGKLIAEKKIINNQIDLNFIPQGIYILKFKNSELKPVKIIKK